MGWQTTYGMIRNQEWINRRVERLTLLGADSARRQVSLDLTLPGDADGVVAVPLAAMAKRHGILGELDIRDEGGDSIPLLTRRQAAELFEPMLQEAARSALGGRPCLCSACEEQGSC